MRWSPEQDRALAQVAAWIADPTAPQVFRLFGYAGTGKTTLAKHLAEGVDGEVLFGAYTGKAAYVLRQKGCTGAGTIHGMIYCSRSKSQERLRELEGALLELRRELLQEGGLDTAAVDNHPQVREVRRKIEKERNALARPVFTLNQESAVHDAELVVIDECSMVDAVMGQDLLSFGKKVLVLGDPAQLPPVMGAGYFTSQDPDFMLTEIHRQAAESPIIRMATLVREGRILELGSYGPCDVVGRSDDMQERVMGTDQILVGKNATRHAYNGRVRKLKNLSPERPVSGDRLVCLQNNHEKGLLNGAVWFADEVMDVDEDAQRVLMSVVSEDDPKGEPLGVEAHLQHFRGGAPAFYERREAEEFCYGYAMTVHKSQGSQWTDVVLFDESGAFREDSNRWLYTGITRAAERLRIVRL